MLAPCQLVGTGLALESCPEPAARPCSCPDLVEGHDAFVEKNGRFKLRSDTPRCGRKGFEAHQRRCMTVLCSRSPRERRYADNRGRGVPPRLSQEIYAAVEAGSQAKNRQVTRYGGLALYKIPKILLDMADRRLTLYQLIVGPGVNRRLLGRSKQTGAGLGPGPSTGSGR